MRATFNSSMKVIEGASVRAGLIVDYAPPRYGFKTGTVNLKFKSVGIDPIVLYIIAAGEPNHIMRLIGALADDGQECLVSVS